MCTVGDVTRDTGSVGGGCKSILTVDADAHVSRTSARQAVGVRAFEDTRVVGEGATWLAGLTQVSRHAWLAAGDVAKDARVGGLVEAEPVDAIWAHVVWRTSRAVGVVAAHARTIWGRESFHADCAEVIFAAGEAVWSVAEDTHAVEDLIISGTDGADDGTWVVGALTAVGNIVAGLRSAGAVDDCVQGIHAGVADRIWSIARNTVGVVADNAQSRRRTHCEWDVKALSANKISIASNAVGIVAEEALTLEECHNLATICEGLIASRADVSHWAASAAAHITAEGTGTIVQHISALAWATNVISWAGDTVGEVAKVAVAIEEGGSRDALRAVVYDWAGLAVRNRAEDALSDQAGQETRVWTSLADLVGWTNCTVGIAVQAGITSVVEGSYIRTSRANSCSTAGLTVSNTTVDA